MDYIAQLKHRLPPPTPVDARTRLSGSTPCCLGMLIRFPSRTAPAGRSVSTITDGHAGARIWDETTIEPTARPDVTRVRRRLYMDVTGAWSWFARDATLKRKREQKLAQDLADLSRWFSRPTSARQ